MQVALPGAAWWWLVLPDPPLLAYELEITLLSKDDLVSPNGATFSAPRFYPTVCLFGNLSRAVPAAGLLGVWKAKAVCEQTGMFPYFCLQLSRTWLRLTVLGMLLESHLFFIPLWFLRLFLSLKPRSESGVAQKEEGCWVSAGFCSALSVLLLQQVGHLGFTVTFVSSFNLPPSASALGPQSRGWAPRQTLHTSQYCQKIPATGGRKRKYGFVIQCWEHSPGQGNPKLWFLLPSKVVSSWLLKMCLSREQWTEISLFPHDCIHSRTPLLLFGAITVTGIASRACTIHAQVQHRQKTD